MYANEDAGGGSSPYIGQTHGKEVKFGGLPKTKTKVLLLLRLLLSLIGHKSSAIHPSTAE